MKRKLLVGLAALMTISGTAYAATAINGLYKGRPIVTVTVNGEPVKSSVPGQVIDGSTMLPMRDIAEAVGAKVTWNQSKYSAEITMPKQPAQQEGLTLAELNKIGESVGMVYSYNGTNLLGTGSGFVTDGNVFITNEHVVDDGVTSIVVLFGDRRFEFSISDAIFINEERDLAAFTITGMPSLDLNLEQPKAGDKVYALGYPKGKFTITEGEHALLIRGMYQNTAYITDGSSGGVLIDSKGKVLGVTSVSNDTNRDWNFSIPSPVLQEELNKY